MPSMIMIQIRIISVKGITNQAKLACVDGSGKITFPHVEGYNCLVQIQPILWFVC
jgi:hypothetical protein